MQGGHDPITPVARHHGFEASGAKKSEGAVSCSLAVEIRLSPSGISERELHTKANDGVVTILGEVVSAISEEA